MHKNTSTAVCIQVSAQEGIKILFSLWNCSHLCQLVSNEFVTGAFTKHQRDVYVLSEVHQT